MKEIIVEDVKLGGKFIKGYKISDDLYGRCRSASLWKSINHRCRTYGSINKFESYQHFAEHIQSLKYLLQKEDNGKYWQIDKDFNLIGDRSYSYENCIMLPNEINSFITSMNNSRNLPLGVTYIDRSSDKTDGLTKPYRANCKNRVDTGSTVYLGYHYTPEDAHFEWLNYKLYLLKKKKDKPLLNSHPMFLNWSEVWINTFEKCLRNKTIFSRT